DNTARAARPRQSRSENRVMAIQEARRTKASPNSHSESDEGTPEQLIELLNDDLRREYQAIIAYVVYSQVLKGAEYMNIAKELEKHAGEELKHALTISKQIG